MKIVVINSGSSSIKYKVYCVESQKLLAGGIVEKIGEDTAELTHQNFEKNSKTQISEVLPNHEMGLRKVVEFLTSADHGVIQNISEIEAVGHRVVHGGDAFCAPVVISKAVKQEIREKIPLAPLHNPANLLGIEVAEQIFTGVPQVAIFDTAFHQTMPDYSYLYPISRDVCKKYHIRRYGFHGTSHQYVAKKAANYLQKPLEQTNLITLHLGNGASVAAISQGKSIDTSMGLTPIEGLMMGTRCGDIDPAIILYLMDHAEMRASQVDRILNKDSGLRGICGVNDMREIESRVVKDDRDAKLALDMYVYRIKKYIGSYYAILGKLDALVFTAGIGENSKLVRRLVCDNLEHLGICFDDTANQNCRGISEIQTSESRIKILVVPTDEEWEIALQTQQLIMKS